MPVLACRYRWEAVLARGYLDLHGVPATVTPGATADPYPSLAAVGHTPLRVLVPLRCVEEARSLLARA